MSKGFTLLELMVTLAVAAILVTVAVPSYRGLVERNSLAAGVNDLVGALNHARSQAVSRGGTICVCSSDNQRRCNDDGDWRPGWITYRAAPGGSCPAAPVDGAIIRVHAGLGPNFRLQSTDTSPLSFNSNGFAMNGRTIQAARANSDFSRAICVAATGRVESVDGAGCAS